MNHIFILLLFILIACNGGGGGTTTGGGKKCKTPAGPFFSVSGTLTYDFVPITTELNFAGKTQQPMRNVYVSAVSDGCSVANTSTDDSGNYTLNVPENSTIHLEIYAKMITPSVVIEDNTSRNAVYVAVTNDRTITANDTLSFNASCGWTGVNDGGSYTSTRVAAPFAILDSIYSAVKKVQAARPAITFPELKVNWSVDNIPSGDDVSTGEIGTSHYDGTELYILGKAHVDSDEFDRHVIVHEWGHFFEGKLSRSDSSGGEHGDGDILDRSLAFGEAWGNALSGIVFDPAYTYLDTMWFTTNQNYVAISMNMETDTDSSPGWYSEVSIQQILFDIYDSHAEGHDTISLGIGPILDVLTGSQKTTPAMTSIHSFITYLKAANGGSTAGINAITANKSIIVNDIYGTGETNSHGIASMLPLYGSLTIGGASLQTELEGSPYRWNEAPNNKYFRFTAAGSSTTINWRVNDTYGIYVIKQGTGIYYDDEIRGNNSTVQRSATFSTTAGQVYIVNFFTEPSLMADEFTPMDIEVWAQ